MTTSPSDLPYGIDDLDPVVRLQAGPPRLVRCFVRGCNEILEAPTRTTRGDWCPEHGIKCHPNSRDATFVYRDPGRNIIVARELFRSRIIGHADKFESHRFGNERSEDAVSFNVWRSLYEARALAKIGQEITGIASTIEPTLYLWGIRISGDRLDFWPLLTEARRRFESNLPVDRPPTEPDIALHLPGKYLILIEAKFTSKNTSYPRGDRVTPKCLTFDELLEIYHDPSLRILDQRRAAAAPRIFYQLWRNTIFSEWMAKLDGPTTQAFHVNLVRDGADLESAAEFHGLVSDEFKQRFQRMTWEKLYFRTADEPRLATMRRYMASKTAGLKPAFNLQ